MIRANNFRVLVAVLAAPLLASLLMMLAGTKPAGAVDIFGVNLIANGDAEAGLGAPDESSTESVPDWTTKGNFTAVKYDVDGFPTSTDPGPPDRGANFFAGGPNNKRSGASQIIDVSAGASEIAADGVTFTLSGYLGGFASQNDHAQLTAIFQGSGGKKLAKSTIGPVTAADRSDTTGLLLESSEGTLPKGTRRIKLVLQMTRTGGSYNDGYADSLSLVLTAPSTSTTTSADRRLSASPNAAEPTGRTTPSRR
jgi:hypothetical protein